MSLPVRLRLALVVLIIAASAAVELPAGDAVPWRKARRSDCRVRDPLVRSGNPYGVAWYARPSDSGHYWGGYVGGGAVGNGQPRFVDEGTWGWDYTGLVLPKLIWLDWFHGRRHQDGGGTYKTDGPKLR